MKKALIGLVGLGLFFWLQETKAQTRARTQCQYQTGTETQSISQQQVSSRQLLRQHAVHDENGDGICDLCGNSMLPLSKGKLLRLKGTVSSLSIALGRGPGFFTLKTTDEKQFSICLGPVPFLLQKGFKLSVGDEVQIDGMQVDEARIPPVIVAVEVKNQTSNKAILLRDHLMRPLWCCRRGHAFH